MQYSFLYTFILIMVYGPRRRPRNYSLNIRHHGYSVSELRRAQKYRRFSFILSAIFQDTPSDQLRNLIIMCLMVVRNVTGNRLAENPIFIRQSRLLADFSDAQLYTMRIRSRAHVPRLLAGLLIPACSNCLRKWHCMFWRTGVSDVTLLVFNASIIIFCTVLLWN